MPATVEIAKDSKVKWQPVPIMWVQANKHVPKETNHSDRYFYHDVKDQVVQIIYRYELADGGKKFTPYTFCKHVETGEMKWRMKGH